MSIYMTIKKILENWKLIILLKKRSTENRGVYISIPLKIDENNESRFSKNLKKYNSWRKYKYI